MTDKHADGLRGRIADAGSEVRGFPRATWLGIAVFVVAGSMAALFGYVVYAGLFSPQPPRTAEERQITVLANLVVTKPKDPAVWADYVQALIDAKQYSKAEAAIARARSLIKSVPEVDLQEARMRYLRGDAAAAMKELDDIVDGINAARKAEMEALAAKGVTGVVTRLDSDALVKALVFKASILGDKGDVKGQIAALTLALLETPSMADVLVIRGDLYLKSGQKDLAEKDYRSALEFVPDYAPAKAGLAKLGKDASK